jgi:hypothetical protein
MSTEVIDFFDLSAGHLERPFFDGVAPFDSSHPNHVSEGAHIDHEQLSYAFTASGNHGPPLDTNVGNRISPPLNWRAPVSPGRSLDSQAPPVTGTTGIQQSTTIQKQRESTSQLPTPSITDQPRFFSHTASPVSHNTPASLSQRPLLTQNYLEDGSRIQLGTSEDVLADMAELLAQPMVWQGFEGELIRALLPCLNK